MTEKLKFIGRVTAIHIVTYILCGIAFSTLLNYQELYALDSIKNFMKPFGGTSTLIGPLVQVLRGILFGIALLFIKDYFTGKLGWLKLWIFIAIIGIINTPAPAPSSIEGIVYTQLPLKFHLKGAPEILVQTLLFAYLVARPKKQKKHNKFIEENKTPLIAAMIGGIGISISGIVLTLLLKLDVMAGASDVGAFAVMFGAMFIIFLSTKAYCRNKPKIVITAVIYYIAVAVMPTVYNYIVDSPFKSLLPLLINIVPVGIMLWFLHFPPSVGKKIER